MINKLVYEARSYPRVSFLPGERVVALVTFVISTPGTIIPGKDPELTTITLGINITENSRPMTQELVESRVRRELDHFTQNFKLMYSGEVYTIEKILVFPALLGGNDFVDGKPAITS